MSDSHSDSVTAARMDQLRKTVEEIIENTSGIEQSEFKPSVTFSEMGLDSLALTQTATAIHRELGVSVSCRQLQEELRTISSLVEFLHGEIDAEMFVELAGEADVAVVETQGTVVPAATDNVTHAIIQNQLQLMEQQLRLLEASSGAPSMDTQPATAANIPFDADFVASNSVPRDHELSNEEGSAAEEPHSNRPSGSPFSQTTKAPISLTEQQKCANSKSTKEMFGASTHVAFTNDNLTPKQQAAFNNFIDQYVAKTRSSKAFAQRHRAFMADPRPVSGSKPNSREMTYPIVVERSQGANLWDIDGNEYIDVTCGSGANFVGHSVDFMVEAMVEQIKSNDAVGPQTPLVGDVAKLFCELTGAERCAFANTSREALLGAIRLARNTTGRELIVMFNGHDHGILDEAIGRGSKNSKSLPAATNIPGAPAENMLILDYGTDESLRVIESRLDEIAAVVVEAVQSHRPEFQPTEFLQELRAMTKHNNAALIFDERLTGFRIAPGGAQEYFGIQADLATYGNIGGGQSLGILAGRSRYIDGLEGNYWEFGDDSKPEAGMPYLAGTFECHPVTMAAANRMLTYIAEEKDTIYDRINHLGDRLAREVNKIFKEHEAPLFFAHFGSLFKVQFEHELPYAELFFASLRQRGIHIWDHRPCFLTLSHTDEDIDNIVRAFGETVIDMQANGFLPRNRKFADSGSTDQHLARVASNEDTRTKS